MIFLLLSICSSTAIYVLFKLFKNWGVDSFQAIVFNYLVAAGFGFLLANQQSSGHSPEFHSWLPYALGIGVIFISMFYLMSKSSQVNGVAITGLATKMSLLIPVAFFILFDPDEALDLNKSLGLILGVLALLLATGKSNTSQGSSLWLPLVIFLGSGVLDLFLAYVEKHFLTEAGDHEWFTPVPFSVAATIGCMVLVIKRVVYKSRLKLKSILAGLLLGIINYGSIYFLLKVLESEILDRSSIIPLNNIGVVTASAAVGIIAFHESRSTRTIIGLVLAVLSITLLAELF